MPTTIDRAEAIARLPPARGCWLCELLERAEPVFCEADAVVFVPEYGVRWGHVLVAPRTHLETFSELSEERWLCLCDLARRAAVALERELSPLRCYVASLGSPATDLPMTCPHLHIHVVPIYAADARPSTVLTWSRGVVVSSAAERAELGDRLRKHLSG